MRRSRLTRLLRNLIRGGVMATALHAQQEITEAQPWQFDSFIADANLEGCSILHCATQAYLTFFRTRQVSGSVGFRHSGSLRYSSSITPQSWRSVVAPC